MFRWVGGGFGLLLLRSGLVVVGIGAGVAVIVMLGVGGRCGGEGGGTVVKGQITDGSVELRC